MFTGNRMWPTRPMTPPLCLMWIELTPLGWLLEVIHLWKRESDRAMPNRVMSSVGALPSVRFSPYGALLRFFYMVLFCMQFDPMTATLCPNCHGRLPSCTFELNENN